MTLESDGVGQESLIYELFTQTNLATYSQSELYALAKRYDMITTWGEDYNRAAINYLKSVNPNILLLQYRNIHAIQENSEDYSLAVSKGWLLYDANGNLVREQDWDSMVCVDVGNVEYQTWLGNWIKATLDNYGLDGVMGDNTSPLLEEMYGVTAPAINPRTGQVYSDVEYRNDIVKLVQKVKSIIGNRVYIGNGVCHQQGGEPLGFWANQGLVEPLINVENGIVIEGFIRWASERWRDTSSWIKDVDALEYISKKGIFTQVTINMYGTLPAGATYDQVVRYGLASYLLGKCGPMDAYRISGGSYPHLNIELGIPLEDYHKRSDSEVYEREFTKILVLVNPTFTDYTIQLGGTYYNNGNPITSITMRAHTGVMLNK
jgi:hypothetical protein